LKSSIEVVGARENNLKDINTKIPREKLTVVTGLSGSGKSSLVFDTIFAEGQRRFLESLSTYARSRLPLIKKPDVSMILGLSPVVSIQQKQGISNPRSTIGSLTDIGSYLRLLFSIAGEAYCPYCDKKINIESTSKIAERIQSLPEGTIIEILAPVYRIYAESYQYLFDLIRNQGYRKFRIDGELYDSGEEIELEENEEYQIEVLIDKFVIRDDLHKQIVDSIEQGLVIGQKFIRLEIVNSESSKIDLHTFYQEFACLDHHMMAGELLPWYFTSNDMESACYTCIGIGTHMVTEPFLLITDENKSIREGAISQLQLETKTFKRMYNTHYLTAYSLSKYYNFSLDTPYKDLPQKIKDILLYGTKGEKFTLLEPEDHHIDSYKPSMTKYYPRFGRKVSFEGIIPRIHRWYKQHYSKARNPKSWEEQRVRRIMIEHTCPDCAGKKLKNLRFQMKVNEKNIFELNSMSIADLKSFVENIQLPENKKKIGEPVVRELIKRLGLMVDIGLDYLSLNRRSDSISGGEIQRTALSTQIGSELMGMLYILDEPSIGLHSRDSEKLIKILMKLRDTGNTVIVVEHDVDTISAADHIIEIGPGPGIHGGEVVAEGTINDIMLDKSSITGKYFSGDKRITYRTDRRNPNGKHLEIIGARENNLQNIDVKIPLGIFICVTGVSGSGKSSLINEILYKGLYAVLRDKRILPGKHDKILGHENLKDVRSIDQTPIGRSSRSNPATYIGFYDKIRKIFADLPESKEKGFTVSDFSYNIKTGGRCVNCLGEGIIKTQLQYMPDIETVCPDCKGARYQGEILEITYRGKNIAEILDLSVEEGIGFFKEVRLIHHKLKVMDELGLGYLKLGQSSNTLSGGEAQRIKLAKELGKIKRLSDNLYILDEPTTGLHLDDINKLLLCLNRIVDAGNTVIVIEHHLDVIKTADYVIDIGPDAADEGGIIVAEGTPEDIINESKSHTGQFLKPYLEV
jgi:excinuclease ABC subunit A